MDNTTPMFDTLPSCVRPHLCETNRRLWDRCRGRHYIGFAKLDEYGRTFIWKCWVATRPRKRDVVLFGLRWTARRRVRVTVYVGIQLSDVRPRITPDRLN